MHHSRKQIIENQTKYREEITDYLKKEFSDMKKELRKIQTKDKLGSIGRRNQTHGV
jgi:hypothetical protein